MFFCQLLWRRSNTPCARKDHGKRTHNKPQQTHFTCQRSEVTKIGEPTARLTGRPPGRLQHSARAHQNRRMAPGRPGLPARTNLTKQQAACRHKDERSKRHATLLLGIRPGSCGPLARHTATYTRHELLSNPSDEVSARAPNTQGIDGANSCE